MVNFLGYGNIAFGLNCDFAYFEKVVLDGKMILCEISMGIVPFLTLNK